MTYPTQRTSVCDKLSQYLITQILYYFVPNSWDYTEKLKLESKHALERTMLALERSLHPKPLVDNCQWWRYNITHLTDGEKIWKSKENIPSFYLYSIKTLIATKDPEFLHYIPLFPNIQAIYFTNCNTLTDNTLKNITNPNNKRLTTLHIHGCSNVTDEGLSALLNKHPSIRYLSIDAHLLTKSCLKIVRKNAVALRYLHIKGSSDRSRKAATAILESLDISFYNILTITPHLVRILFCTQAEIAEFYSLYR